MHQLIDVAPNSESVLSQNQSPSGAVPNLKIELFYWNISIHEELEKWPENSEQLIYYPPYV